MFFSKKDKIGKDDILDITTNFFDALRPEGITINEKNISSLIIVGDKISLIISVNKNLADSIPEIRNKLTEIISTRYPKAQINIVFTNDEEFVKNDAEKPAEKNNNIPKPPTPKAVSGIKRIIAVASGKGGVGKSTIATHLAIAYARKGLNVGLVDADIHGPSIARMMGISEEPVVKDNMMIPITRNDVKCMSMGFLLGDNAPAVWRGPMVTKALHQLILSANWNYDGKDLDVLIMDLPPGTGDIQLSLAQNYKIDGAILVSTPQEIALLDVRKAFSMFEKVNIPILGVIENMAYFEDNSGNRNYLFGIGAVEKFCKENNIKLLAQIPINPEIAKLCDAGTNTDNPIVELLNHINL